MDLQKTRALKGEVIIPGDKSISHRAIMLGAIAEGTTEITGFLEGADCLATIRCFQKMGIAIEKLNGNIYVHGKGLHGLKASDSILDVSNSGTTIRLMSGILCGQPFSSVLTGDSSIQKRPMKRILIPLIEMGASIKSQNGSGCAPLVIQASRLHGIRYNSPVASAQVKSCVLFAGLYAEGETNVTEPYLSRNHTELMLHYFGASVLSKDKTASLIPPEQLSARKIEVPGDISSAAYFLAAAAIVPNSELLIKNVGINPTRDGILRVMKDMGAKFTLENKRILGSEPVADICIRSSSLKGVTIGGDLIPALIDEIPVIAVLAAFANGETIIKDAAELKVKESNRIDSMVENLCRMGADAEATPDGMIIRGGCPLKGAVIETKKDHRIAMSFAVAALCASETTTLLDSDCVEISYPGFFKDLARIANQL